ncbi:hypothetical protein [Salinisphaera aquimarina]|uniref:SMODS-associating 2TM beta-strand rich effector domain-containing protein n=1 Tax=Salinisphaera aquimarina TaxID=2094031 RepID=A0ABV7EU19_9GAMM
MITAFSIRTRVIVVLFFLCLGWLISYAFVGVVNGSWHVGLFEAIRIGIKGVAPAVGLAIILGHPRVIDFIWRCFPWLNSLIAPNLNGVYKLWIGTNFKLLLDRKNFYEGLSDVKADASTEINSDDLAHIGIVCVKAGLFAIRIHMTPLEDAPSASSSNVISAVLEKAPSEGGFRLHYIFESHVSNPSETDTQKYYGAATLQLSAGLVSDCSGDYWTNRAWFKGLNTAGRVRITRIAP